jgi:pimeloyl-ACP methyl ester carboxylesterase
MKKILTLLCLSAAILVNAQEAKIDTGRINGAVYHIAIPANWNHNLVMYAHGYEMPTMPSNPAQFHNDGAFKPFFDRGFAVARSAYRKKGWALVEGVDDTEALRDYFVKKYGKPDTCYITGHSMGGGITLATIEYFGKNYQGGMPMCPLSNHPYLQTKLAFDINAVFAVFFPGVLPSLADVTSGKAPALSFPAIQAAISKDTALAALIARRFDLKPADLPMVIMFDDLVLRDISSLAQGNPFDNTNMVYTGFPDDLAVNLKIERVPAKKGTENFYEKYDRTGEIDCPVVLLHTIYDQLIPPEMGVDAYDNMVHLKGKQQNLAVIYTNGQGHCNFTPQQTGIAFDMLRKWKSTGIKPASGFLK